MRKEEYPWAAMLTYRYLPRITVKKTTLALLVCLLLLSCSNDSGGAVEPEIETVDLSVIQGRYKGSWKWDIGEGLISMIISPGETANQYKVEYFESNNYRPRSQTDGVSPDALGELIIDGMNVTIDLNHIVNDPPCPGKFTGTGTFNTQGELDLMMNIDDCFADNLPATWELEKKENL